jgi:transposase-like protein
MAAARGARSSTGDRRDFNQLARVRLRAARMFEQGTSQAEVAHRLGTSRQNAHRWHRQWQQGGRAALRAAERAGRKPRLDRQGRRPGRTCPGPGCAGAWVRPRPDASIDVNRQAAVAGSAWFISLSTANTSRAT